MLEKNEDNLLAEKVRKNIESFVGRRFEFICKEIMEGMNEDEKISPGNFNSQYNVYCDKKLPFVFQKIGREWGKIPKAEKGKNTYEIDLVSLNEKTKQILFAECKWQEKVNAEEILAELKKKAKHVCWFNNDRREYFAIFARSFRKKSKDCLCLDLRMLEKFLERG